MKSEYEMLDSAFDDNSYENTSEDEILIWRTLINLVQPNLILYQKKHKGYTDKNKKIQLWNNIGASLTPPITDKNSEKSAEKSYSRNQDLAQDNIKFPAISILKKDMASQMSQFISSQLTSSQLANSQPATSTSAIYPSTYTPPLTSEESTDKIWSIDYETLDSDIIYVENEKATSIAGFIELFSSTYNLLTSQSNASTSVAKAIVSTITPQKLTPSADTKKRKWQTNDEIDTVMLESSKNISSLANTLEMALKQNLTSVESQTTKPELPHAVENMMSGIALGLSKVCEERQMDCFISILACINEFIKK